MAGCADFVEEETLLQQRARQLRENLGVSVVMDCTPKGHSGLAGEGIEYTFANSKIFLCHVPIGKRKTVEQLHKQVRLALSTRKDTNLNKTKFVNLWHAQETSLLCTTSFSHPQVTPKKNKNIKHHRS
eukprot:13531473-Ditylum_brightwellii.AAC.1